MNKPKKNNMDIEEIINKTAKATAREVLAQSKEQQQKELQLGSFKKTEKILYEYPHWKNTDVKETVRFCNMIEKLTSHLWRKTAVIGFDSQYFFTLFMLGRLR